MEQSLRLLLTEGSKLNEQTLLNVYNKLNAPGNTFSSDLYILTAEKLFELPPPLQKHIIDKAENMITIYNRLQEPLNQFQIRSLICQSLINSSRARQLRGNPATELDLKAIDFIIRALKLIQSNNLYQPLSLRAIFIYYQIAFPFFINEKRHHLAQVTPIALSLLEPHLTGKFDPVLRLYISLSLLHGCILDDFNKCDEASKQMQKLFTLVPTNLLTLRYSLLHYYTHFSRKSTGGIMKQKLDLNEQLQKAVVMYQTARSNNATSTKDLAEVLKICLAFLESKKEANEETFEAEIIIGETGRLAAQFGQTQVAEECQAKASTARSQIARLHATLISAELMLSSDPTPEERAEMINNCNHAMSLAMYQGDLVTVQDAASILWTHSLKLLDTPQLLKRYLTSACDILLKVNSQANVLRTQIHFALGKIFNGERDNAKALDNLKKALSLDYLVTDHPTKLIHPFDRFLVPFYRMLNVTIDAYGIQPNPVDHAYSYICLPKKVNQQSIDDSLNAIKKIQSSDIVSYDAIDAAHYCSVFHEIIKNASLNNAHSAAIDGCHYFLGVEFETIQFDAAVELQCEATVYAITSCFQVKPENIQYALEFVTFSIARSKILKKNRLAYNSISSIWNSFFSLQNPEKCTEYADFLLDCVTHLFESDFPQSKSLVGQIVNFYVKVVMAQTQEQAALGTSQNKKKGPSLDQAKQKQLKTAEELIYKCLPVITSTYEKKALIDRIVELCSKRNQLPPNQSDPELSILVTLATIMNDKVQHKPETLTNVYNQILTLNKPVLFALLAEKACKLDLHQITIDSATKIVEQIPSPKDKDEKYYVALARFYRGLAFLKLIQPDLQEFSCQDKLRFDSSSDFLRATFYFSEAKATENAKTSLSYFVSTVTAGENFPRFRALLLDLLEDSISISRKIIIGDDLRVRIYRIYLLSLIDQKDFTKCKKVIQNAITTLNKSVHCHLWDLNLIVTFHLDCETTQQPLIDEMLRVKQLGDIAYQTKLWTFVADLATDESIQQTALKRAIETLRQENADLRFKCNMNYAKWLFNNNYDWTEIESTIEKAEQAIGQVEAPEVALEYKFQIASFKLMSTSNFDVFKVATNDVEDLGNQLWEHSVALNTVPDDDDASTTTKRSSSSRSKSQSHKNSQTSKLEEFIQAPQNINEWIQMMQQVESHKTFIPQDPYTFVSNLLDIVDILQNFGYEYSLLKIWYHILQFSRSYIRNQRFDQYLYMKLKLFLDRLNFISPFAYSNDFVLNEAEKNDWDQKVSRYQADPPSKQPPLRKLLNKQAEILIALGEYRSALYLINSALSQAEQLEDKETEAESIQMIAIIKSNSGEYQEAIDMLAKSVQNMTMPIEYWCKWYSAASSVPSNTTDFIMNLLQAFQQNCLASKTLSINETTQVYLLYRNAARSMSPEGAYSIYENMLKGKLMEDKQFIPTLDTITQYYWRSLLSPQCPKNLSHFEKLGHEILKLIDAYSDNYNKVVDAKGDEASIPLLCRFVDSINLFGYLVLKYAHVIRSLEVNGLDMNLVGSHTSLLNEFMDKSQEPLADLSPTAAILHFDNVKNNEFVPLKYAVRMNVYLGQCLHAIATENVTLQSSVRYLWKGISQLTELKEFSLTGEIAQELFSILRSSDITGAVYQYLVAQSVTAYQMRINMLQTDTEPTNRERLFVNENLRLRERFLNPQISQMFVSSQKYFEVIPNGTSLVRLGRKMDEIRTWVNNNKSCLIIIIDDITSSSDINGDVPHITASVIQLGTPDKYDSIPLDVDFDEISMKFEIFKQIISTAKTDATTTDPVAQKATQPPGSRGKGGKARRSTSKVQSTLVKTDTKDSSFAKEALKTNHPEFTKFIEDLSATFEPLHAIIPEEHSDVALLLSSIKSVHTIPFECLNVFQSFGTIYRDFSIMSAMNRAAPSTDVPSLNLAS